MLEPEDLRKIETALAATRDNLTETIRDVETNLLKAFHSYATGQLARAAGQEANITALSARVAVLEQRLLELETRPRPQ